MSKRTYFQMVDDLVKLADNIYDRSGALRDAATGKEKDIFNECRGATMDLATKLRRFRDGLPADRAEMDLGGWKKPIIDLGD